jgi:hypothetical protein
MYIPNRASSGEPRPAGKVRPVRAARPGRRERRIAIKLRLALRMAAVDDLQGQLARLCSDMMETTISRDKLYQARMLALSLLHAKRLVEIALEAAERSGPRPHFN